MVVQVRMIGECLFECVCDAMLVGNTSVRKAMRVLIRVVVVQCKVCVWSSSGLFCWLAGRVLYRVCVEQSRVCVMW